MMMNLWRRCRPANRPAFGGGCVAQPCPPNSFEETVGVGCPKAEEGVQHTHTQLLAPFCDDVRCFLVCSQAQYAHDSRAHSEVYIGKHSLSCEAMCEPLIPYTFHPYLWRLQYMKFIGFMLRSTGVCHRILECSREWIIFAKFRHGQVSAHPH